MLRNWKPIALATFVGLCTVVIVSDVEGGIFRRRRSRTNNNAYVSYRTGTVNSGMNAGVGAGANVPGVAGASADGNLNVRGQTPDATRADATVRPTLPATPAPPPTLP